MNDRDFIPADRSGYVHAEENALLKAGAIEKDKVMFLTHTPCVMCAKRRSTAGSRAYIAANPISAAMPWHRVAAPGREAGGVVQGARGRQPRGKRRAGAA